MDNLQDLANFVMQHGGIFVRRDSVDEGGDEVEHLYFTVVRGELRLSRSIRDGLGCAVRARNAQEESAGGWKPIFAYTVPGYEQMDTEASIAWVTSVPQGDAYVDFLKRHIAEYLSAVVDG